MAVYLDEGEVWKCPKHPSKRRRSGICPICLKDRLITLCPDCANVRPCACCTTSSSSSSSSSFSLFSSRGDASKSGGVGSVGRVSNLIDSEPAFRRSRSVGMNFLRSRFAGDRDVGITKPPLHNSGTKPSLWSVFKTQKAKKGEGDAEDVEAKKSKVVVENDFARMMMRSRSVSVPIASNSSAGVTRSSSSKGKGWYFSSPLKAFRQSKTSKVIQERSPLYRG